MAQDRAKLYANQHQAIQAFEVGEQVFLQVKLESNSMSTRKCLKLTPQHSELFEALEKVADVAYHFQLSSHLNKIPMIAYVQNVDLEVH